MIDLAGCFLSSPVPSRCEADDGVLLDGGTIIALLLGSPEATSMEGCRVLVSGGDGASRLEVGQKRRDPSDPLPNDFFWNRSQLWEWWDACVGALIKTNPTMGPLMKANPSILPW